MRPLRCAPELLARDLRGRTYIVTGANSGVGLATTCQLVRQGGHVVMGCRRVEAGERAIGPLGDAPGTYEVLPLDLSRLDSVRAFVASFRERHARLDALVNNAGIMMVPFRRTEDGFESQFGVNHLGHWLLTELLLDVLQASAPSRVVILSSVAHAGSPKKRVTLELDDLNWERRSYDRVQAYCQSKLANVLHARELARRLEGTGVSAFSVHPGWVRSNLVASSMPAWIQNVALRPFSGLLGMMSNEDGAQASLHCLLDDEAPRHSGAYFSQISRLYAEQEYRRGGWPMRSPNPHARDDELARKLDAASRELVGPA